MKKTVFYGAAFVLTVVLCIAMLLVGTFAPQEAVDRNIRKSVDNMEYEGLYPVAGGVGESAVLDTFTDALILMESRAMVRDSKSTILTNPLYIHGGNDPIAALREYVDAEKPEPSSYYTRYWMGFRAVMRWLLVFLDYYQIRRYAGFALFALYVILINRIAKHFGSGHSLAFAFSVLLVRPQIVGACLQYACCFLIAFSAMLAIPWLHKHRRFQGLFFMELGVITMFFDFYTTPLITFGLPMIYLCLFQLKEDGRIPVGEMLKSLLLWLVGYLCMWGSKLVLTELLTGQPALRNAWGSVAIRLGLGGNRAENAEMYSLAKAFRRVREVILPDTASVWLFWICLAGLAGLLVWKWRRRELNGAQAKKGMGLLVIAIMPVIWFAMTAQPVIIHAFFQYRSIVLLYWAAAAWLCLLLEKSAKTENIPCEIKK